MSAEVHSVSDILARLDDVASTADRLDWGTVVEAFGQRSHGPLLLLPALVEISPLGGIPGVASAMALTVAVIAGQMAFKRQSLWLPRVLSKRTVASTKVREAARKLRPLAERLDRWFHRRLRRLTQGGVVRVAAVACVLLACTVPPLEVVPFASTAPMAAIALFGLALLVHDGVLMGVAFATAAAALAFVGAVLA